MNVEQLIEKLQQCDPKAIVITTSTDMWGGDLKLQYVIPAFWDEEAKTFGQRELNAELISAGFTGDYLMKEDEGVPCIVFYPEDD